MSLSIITRPLGGSALARDYVAGAASARAFFASAPDSLAVLREKLAEVSARFDRPARVRAAAALRPTSARAAERLARFVDEGGAVLTTGQQTGLFTGPLYTIYKALTVVELARAAEAELGVIVLPVFWSASEDHDWAEVDHADLLTPARGLVQVRLAETDARPLPMSERSLAGGLENALDVVRELSAKTKLGGGCLELVEASYRPGASVSDAFADLVAGLFGGYDLLIADAADPALKAASRALLEADLTDGGRAEHLLQARAEELSQAGYHAQVPILPDATNVFYHGAAGRERLYRRGGLWVGHDTGERFQRAELLARLGDEPGRFSPNVVLRPVIESAVFPTLAYVAGPGEISYFAQLEPLFREHGIRPPLVVPRLSATLLPDDVAADLEALGLDLDALDAPRHELRGALARRGMPPALRAALDDLKLATVHAYDRVAREAARIDPTLGQGIESRRNRALLDAGDTEGRVVRALKRHDPDTDRRLDRALSTLRPLGAAQERVLNVIPFLAEYGPALLGDLAAAVSVPW